MKMPSFETALVPMAKITDYLLSRTHPRGSIKAVWFESLGFVADRPDELAAALSAHASQDVEESERTRYGTKYCLAGDIVGPDGARGRLRSVWIVLHPGEPPRLVTAYPSK